jgi:hypothetical protein
LLTIDCGGNTVVHVHVVIEFAGEAAEVQEWLARLAGDVSVPHHPGVTIAPAGWTPELADKLVGRISPRARDALRSIARNAPEASFETVQEDLGVEGLGLGGILASIGFAARAGIPRPYAVDKFDRCYLMDSDVAEVVLDALDRREAEVR